jgi:hypothetical protein
MDEAFMVLVVSCGSRLERRMMSYLSLSTLQQLRSCAYTMMQYVLLEAHRLVHHQSNVIS